MKGQTIPKRSIKEYLDVLIINILRESNEPEA